MMLSIVRTLERRGVAGVKCSGRSEEEWLSDLADHRVHLVVQCRGRGFKDRVHLDTTHIQSCHCCHTTANSAVQLPSTLHATARESGANLQMIVKVLPHRRQVHGYLHSSRHQLHQRTDPMI